jgi:DNA-binding transcriptional regulator YhcF (GntR family)
VRELAAELSMAPMTVNQVYQRLRTAGLIEIRRGSGAFVARNPQQIVAASARMAALRLSIDAVLDEADAVGLPSAQLVSLVNAQIQMRRLQSGLRLMFVGLFDGPTRDYAANLQPALGAGDRIDITTIDRLRTDADARAACGSADLVLTFIHRLAEVQAIVPDARLLAIRFIPSEATRQALAALDPRARVAAVTRFQDYIAIMRPSIQQFAPHVSDIKVTWSEAPDLAGALADRDVVVFASGADHVTQAAAPTVRCFEYRHAPDPGEVERVLIPFLANLRGAKSRNSSHLKRAAS